MAVNPTKSTPCEQQRSLLPRRTHLIAGPAWTALSMLRPLRGRLHALLPLRLTEWREPCTRTLPFKSGLTDREATVLFADWKGLI